MSEESCTCPKVCPLCDQKKEYLVKISVEFPNPLIKKYPDVMMDPYTVEMFYCHLCAFEIFKKVYREMHEDLRAHIEEDDYEISEALKHGKVICSECGTKMDDGNDFSCQTKEELK